MPQTPVTSAPSTLAICTANVPMPPPAPVIKTFWPGRTPATSRSARRAVSPDIGTAAASSNVSPAGFGTSWPAVAAATSAKAPACACTSPKTSSPTRRPLTCLPTCSTTPARSQPRTRVRGRRSPMATRAT